MILFNFHLQTSMKGWIRHEGTQFCLGLNKDSTGLSMARCTGSSEQVWYWGRSFPVTTWPPKEEYEYEEEDESKFIQTQTIFEEEEEEEKEQNFKNTEKSGENQNLAQSFTNEVENGVKKPKPDDYYDNY